LEEASKNFSDSLTVLELQCHNYKAMNDIANCESKCLLLLKMDPKNEFASLTIADILIQQKNFDQAFEQYLKFLEVNPDNYGILSKLIDLFRRSKQLVDAKPFIQRAEDCSTNKNIPGLCYCRALYYKYNRCPKEALIEFNKARKNQEYFEDSLAQMIDIYLNPEEDLAFNQAEQKMKPVDPDNLKADTN